VRLDGLLPRDLVEQARAAVLRPLEKRGLWRDGAWRLDAMPKPAWPDHGPKTRDVIGGRQPELAAMLETPALTGMVAELLEWKPIDRRMHPRPQVLFTLPNIERWVLPPHWHTDVPRLRDCARPGVQVFTFLEPAGPRGGATMAIAGSHRLLVGQRRNNRQMLRALAPEPFFRQLLRTTPTPWADDAELPVGAVTDLPLRVIELTGSPGDVWLVDMGVYHSGSPNAAASPRLMVTHRYVRADALPEIAEVYGWEPSAPTDT